MTTSALTPTRAFNPIPGSCFPQDYKADLKGFLQLRVGELLGFSIEHTVQEHRDTEAEGPHLAMDSQPPCCLAEGKLLLEQGPGRATDLRRKAQKKAPSGLKCLRTSLLGNVISELSKTHADDHNVTALLQVQSSAQSQTQTSVLSLTGLELRPLPHPSNAGSAGPT